MLNTSHMRGQGVRSGAVLLTIHAVHCVRHTLHITNSNKHRPEDMLLQVAEWGWMEDAGRCWIDDCFNVSVQRQGSLAVRVSKSQLKGSGCYPQCLQSSLHGIFEQGALTPIFS